MFFICCELETEEQNHSVYMSATINGYDLFHIVLACTGVILLKLLLQLSICFGELQK